MDPTTLGYDDDEKAFVLQNTINLMEQELELKEAKESTVRLTDKIETMEQAEKNYEKTISQYRTLLNNMKKEMQKTREELENVSKALEEERQKKVAPNQEFENELQEGSSSCDLTTRLSRRERDSESELECNEQIAKLKFALALKEHLLETSGRGSLTLVAELRNELRKTKGELCRKEEEILEVQGPKRKSEESASANSSTLQEVDIDRLSSASGQAPLQSSPFKHHVAPNGLFASWSSDDPSRTPQRSTNAGKRGRGRGHHMSMGGRHGPTWNSRTARLSGVDGEDWGKPLTSQEMRPLFSAPIRNYIPMEPTPNNVVEVVGRQEYQLQNQKQTQK